MTEVSRSGAVKGGVRGDRRPASELTMRTCGKVEVEEISRQQGNAKYQGELEERGKVLGLFRRGRSTGRGRREEYQRRECCRGRALTSSTKGKSRHLSAVEEGVTGQGERFGKHAQAEKGSFYGDGLLEDFSGRRGPERQSRTLGGTGKTSAAVAEDRSVSRVVGLSSRGRGRGLSVRGRPGGMCRKALTSLKGGRRLKTIAERELKGAREKHAEKYYKTGTTGEG